MMSGFTFQKVVLSLCILILFDCHILYGKVLIEVGSVLSSDTNHSVRKSSQSSNSTQVGSDIIELYKNDKKPGYCQKKELEAAFNEESIKHDERLDALNSLVVFDTEDYEIIKKKAQKEQKLIFVNFVMESCIRCNEIEEAISSSEDLQYLIDKHFIRYKIDIKSKKKHPLVKEWRIKSAPLLAVVSPWGHVLNMYNSSSNSEAVETILKTTVADVDLDRVFLKMDSINSVGGNVKKRVDVELLKISFVSSVVNKLFLYQDVLGPKKQWGARANRELIFKLLPDVDDKSLQVYFLNHLTEFRNMYPKDEVNEKVYKIAFLDDYRAHDLNSIFKFLELYIFDDVQYYLIRSEIEFYTFVLPDPLARFNAQLDLYLEFQYDEWSDFKSIFLEMILAGKTQEDFHYLEQIALKFEPYAVDYEWLDLYSLLLYRSGLEEEALELINEIKTKAYEKGINYKPAIYNLKKK